MCIVRTSDGRGSRPGCFLLASVAGVFAPGVVALAAPVAVGSATVTLDGAFGAGEWDGITPLAFISPADGSGQLFRTTPGDAAANSFVYVAADSSKQNVAMMFDYLPRTNPTFAADKTVATFGTAVNNFNTSSIPPLLLPQIPPLPITATLDVNSTSTANTYTGTIRATDGNGAPIGGPQDVQNLGDFLQIGFGDSPNSTTEHMRVEMLLPLGQALDLLNAQSGGLLDLQPDDVLPAELEITADILNDATDPPAARFILQLDSTTEATIDADVVPVIPLPPAAVPGMIVLGGLIVRRMWPARGPREQGA